MNIKDSSVKWQKISGLVEQWKRSLSGLEEEGQITDDSLEKLVSAFAFFP